MKMLVHFPSATEAPIGLWWFDPISDSPQSVYVDSTAPAATLGRVTVMAKTVEDVPWEVWFDQIAARPPYFGVWETLESETDPEETLAYLVKHAEGLLGAP